MITAPKVPVQRLLAGTVPDMLRVLWLRNTLLATLANYVVVGGFMPEQLHKHVHQCRTGLNDSANDHFADCCPDRAADLGPNCFANRVADHVTDRKPHDRNPNQFANN